MEQLLGKCSSNDKYEHCLFFFVFFLYYLMLFAIPMLNFSCEACEAENC